MVKTAPKASQTTAELWTSRICCAQPRSNPRSPSEATVIPSPIMASADIARSWRAAGFSEVLMWDDDSVQKSNYKAEDDGGVAGHGLRAATI